MPLTALLLVLAAALLHASWNIAAKKAGGGDAFMLINALMIGALWAAPALWLAGPELQRWGGREWALAAGSALLHLVYYRTLLTGYRLSDLTVVYPVARGSGPLVTVAVAILLLGEPASISTLLGAAGVCLGVFALAGGPRLWRLAHEGGHDPAQRVRVRAGLYWGGLTGLAIAGYTVLDGYAVKVMAMSPLLVEWVSNALRLPVLLPLALRDRAGLAAAWRTQWRYSLVIAVLAPAGYMAVLYAVQIAPLSHVAPAREVSMLFAALLGGRLLGEGDRGARLLGAALIAGGVAALALG